ncbi:type I restriction endonuclease subunit R [Halodesulfurarchaeum sp. HSR-GB]|uniref:type I restriction endonuclease subunit R n=1 Tax=Halodesulfurarchaeum sp. HSR-GB TaxID=3074077 RepID=UPI002855E024|nr:type I restriction endonuclease subunit R [Halodesulfurarchaeum sp. HSR-GB]MDR5656506.1 type I restriction endonuclease subunit R [Halodesulfurarchaeum sp. HSR-GB]
MGLDELNLAEKPAIEIFRDLGYGYLPSSDLRTSRLSVSDVILKDRLRDQVRTINPDLPEDAREEAIRHLTSTQSPNLLEDNQRLHQQLVDGVQVEYEQDGEQVGRFVQPIDFENPENNDWLITTQFTVQVGDNPRRKPDMVVFINGLPIGVLEFKNPTDPKATLENAYDQVNSRYRDDIAPLLRYNEVIGLADMNEARIGCLDAGWQWYRPWRYIEKEGDERDLPEEEVLLRGVFKKEHLLDLIENFIVFSEKDGQPVKMLAGYHQFYGVREAVKSAKETQGDELGRIGVYWHTQGSGKSLSMVYFVRKIRRSSDFGNPTFVVVTDRNELDEQITHTFSDAGYNVSWADSIPDLRNKLDRQAGGLIFTTIQKFQTHDDERQHPVVNEREDVIVMADEAHRSQTKELGQNLRDALPNASFIGFTATPIHDGDNATRVTFGDYVSQYTIDRSEEDGSTVPIYYESRFAKLQFNKEAISESVRELLDSGDEELENELIGKWTNLRRIIENADNRLKKIAGDMVGHYNDREIEGKAMVVSISRKAAVKYKRYIEQQPNAPEVGVVISEPEEYIDQPTSEDKLKRRFKDPDDPLKIIVVCDKWTTGFDCPPLHTLYIDRPMKNHNLLQTIGRVNRVYKDKPGGLVVDYIGIAEDLRKALDKYTSDIQEMAMVDVGTAVEVMKQKHHKVTRYLTRVDYEGWQELSNLELSRLIHRAESEVIATEEKQEEFLQAVSELKRAFALVTPHNAASEIRSDLLFFEAVRDGILSLDPKGKTGPTEVESAMKDLISEGVTADDVVAIAGFDKWKSEEPIVSDEFLSDVESVEQPELQVKMLEKLLRNEISTRKQQNLAKYESFQEELEETLNEYNNQFLTTEEVIQELRNYAEKLKQEDRRKERLGLSAEELAFYDAIATNTETEIDSELLQEIAQEVCEMLKENVNIDWTNRKAMRSKLKTRVKGLLRENGLSHSDYQPLVDPIVHQAEALYGDVSASAH